MIDIRDPAFLTTPGPVLAELRAEGPLVRVRLPMLGRIWLTTTDAAARELLKDTTRFARDPAVVTGKPMDRTYWWIPRMARPLMQNMLLKEGGDHRRLRGAVDRAFAKHSIAEMRPALEARADALLDALPPEGDIRPGYARALPFEAICLLLGLPQDDWPFLRRAVAPLSSAGSALGFGYAILRLGRVMRYFRARFEEARAGRGTGFIAALVAEDLSEDELLAMVMTLFLAGHETTVHLLGNLIALLGDRPDLRRGLSAPGAMGLFIEEGMRHFTPAMLTKVHFAREDCEFQSVRLAKGDKVSALLLSANHDPDRFDGPETFQPGRRPNAHLGFGHGAHVCLGMQLARLEAEVAVERLLARYPDYALTAQPRWLRRLGLRGPDALPVRLTPRRSNPPR